jgi:hypothetical protein
VSRSSSATPGIPNSAARAASLCGCEPDERKLKAERVCSSQNIGKIKKLYVKITVMGQIVIETPNRLKRRYQIDQKNLSELVEFLDSSGVRLDFSQLTSEDLADIRSARNARKEESIAWEDAKAQLGL